MKKSVLRSVKPYWIYCILEGLKKIEVGKDFPTAEDWDRTVFLYCSKDRKSLNRIPVEKREQYAMLMGKVVGRFVCDCVEEYRYSFLSEYYPVKAYVYNQSRLSIKEFERYGNGKTLYGWRIFNLETYDKPKELSSFYSTSYRKKCSLCVPLCEKYPNCSLKKNRKSITRPPQSWFYVEVGAL